MDAAGDTLWTKCLGGSDTDRSYSIHQTSDGGYVLVGETRSNDGEVSGNHGLADAWIVKLDGSGTLLWSKCTGGSGSDAVASVHLTSNGDYIVAGHTFSTDGDVNGNHGYDNVWVVKLGLDEVGLSEAESPQFTIVPKSHHGCLHPSTRATRPGATGHLLDATGRTVFTRRIGTTGHITLGLSGQESGLYLLHVEFADGTFAVQRVIKE